MRSTFLPAILSKLEIIPYIGDIVGDGGTAGLDGGTVLSTA